MKLNFFRFIFKFVAVPLVLGAFIEFFFPSFGFIGILFVIMFNFLVEVIRIIHEW